MTKHHGVCRNHQLTKMVRTSTPKASTFGFCAFRGLTEKSNHPR